MNKDDVRQYILTNEPVFEYNDIQYSICCLNDKFYTSDENGNEKDFDSFEDLLSSWK